MSLRVGIVGTGYVAKARAEIFRSDPRTELVAIAGSPERVTPLAQEWGIAGYFYWSELVVSNELDVVVVANVNREHASVVRQALKAGKQVIVDYPLAFDYQEAVELWALADRQELVLHTEQIEILTGVHQQARAWLTEIGDPCLLKYSTTNPQRPAPQKWTYQPSQFGFPLLASVSRLHRLIDLAGTVEEVFCQLQYRGDDLPYSFHTCMCQVLLRFSSGAIAEVGYHKGEQVWQSERVLEVQGTRGGIFFRSEQGKLVTPTGEETFTAPPPKGLFRQDTEQFLAHLLDKQPIYTDRHKVLHAIATANACEKSVQEHRPVRVQEITG